jgi:hypothetical protein
MAATSAVSPVGDDAFEACAEMLSLGSSFVEEEGDEGGNVSGGKGKKNKGKKSKGEGGDSAKWEKVGGEVAIAGDREKCGFLRMWRRARADSGAFFSGVSFDS